MGKAQLRIPAREGEREQDRVGRTCAISDKDHNCQSLRGGDKRWTRNEISVPGFAANFFPLPVPCAVHPLYRGHWGHTWWLGDDHHIAGQPDITGSTALEWDGRALEVV